MTPDTSPLDSSVVRSRLDAQFTGADEDFNSFLDSWLINNPSQLVHSNSNVSSSFGNSQDQPSQHLPSGLRHPGASGSVESTNPNTSGEVPFATAYPADAPVVPAPAPRAKGGITVKPTSLKHAKVLEKNRRAQARFREKQKQKEKDMETQLQALQQQLQAAHLETNGFKRQNEVLSKVLELRQNHIEVLTDAANRQSGGAAAATTTPATAAPPTQAGMFGISAAPISPIPDLDALKAMTARDAAARWREYVQHMATLLLECETPCPAPGAVERLETHAELTGTFLQRLAVVNPSVAKAISRYNLDTLELFDDCNFRTEAFRQPFWQQKVESLMLTQEQKEQVAILMRHHQAALAQTDAEVEPLLTELKQLLPSTIGIDKQVGIKGCVRSHELINLIRKNFHQKHQAWFTLAATILGKLLTRMQFARFCVNSYPYIPIVRAITSSVTILPAHSMPVPAIPGDTKPSPILTA